LPEDLAPGQWRALTTADMAGIVQARVTLHGV